MLYFIPGVLDTCQPQTADYKYIWTRKTLVPLLLKGIHAEIIVELSGLLHVLTDQVLLMQIFLTINMDTVGLLLSL